MWASGLGALTVVSSGTHHVFVQRVTYPWDVVPGLALLRAAGGAHCVWPPQRDEKGKPMPWCLPPLGERSGILAACNDTVLRDAVKALF
jgi:fructose-1,6-bisphosphatase/inositol monophosphatase family enzyme